MWGWFTLVSVGFTHQLPQPWGIFRACLWTQPQPKVCLHKSTFQSSKSLLCTKLALLSATKGQELEPMRAMHQTPALGSVTATLQRAAFTPCQSKSSSCTLPLSVPCLVLRKSAVLNWANLFLFCMFSLGEGGQGEVGVNSTQYWNYCKQIEIFHVTHLGRNTPCKANSQKGLLKKRNRWFYTRINQQHFSSFTLAAAISHLLFCQSLLDFLVITDVINNRLGKLRLNPGQPGAKVTHVFVQ